MTDEAMASDGPFSITFDAQVCQVLDQHALEARQDRNFGNRDRWFQSFRGGLYGMYARQRGLTKRYGELHTWTMSPRDTTATHMLLGELFFNADSTLECLVFALNALGHGVSARGFRNTLSESQLRSVHTRDPISGKLPEWSRVFPTFSSRLEDEWDEWVQPVVDQHDVAKHRKFVFRGGRARDDPPPGFWKALGLGEEKVVTRIYFTPFAEVLLLPDPKRPRKAGETTAYEDAIKLETLIPEYAALIDELIACALDDVRSTVPLDPGSE